MDSEDDCKRTAADRFRALVMGFAIGDALGSPFEFQSPSGDDIAERFHGTDLIEFTDDTLLLLSSIAAFQEAWNRSRGPSTELFWKTMDHSACSWLVDWLHSDDLRGIGNTTLAALKQIRRHHEANGTYEGFQLTGGRGYDPGMSAGNGVLSRVVPLIGLGVPFSQRLRSWLALTHIHVDGHEAAARLARWMTEGKDPRYEVSGFAKGFYAPETVQIAVDAVKQAKTVCEVFGFCMRPEGDNDSTAALALGLWYWRHGADKELERLWARLNEDDRRMLDNAIIAK